MKKRTKQGQKKHDEGVLKSAKYYKSQGFDVKADLPDMQRPKSINGRRPDLIAKKGTNEIVVEVETTQTIKKDKSQHKVFADYVSGKSNRKFRVKKV